MPVRPPLATSSMTVHSEDSYHMGFEDVPPCAALGPAVSFRDGQFEVIEAIAQARL